MCSSDCDGTELTAELTRRQWELLDDLLTEVCSRSGGKWEDLHDRGRGVLEAVRPVSWGDGDRRPDGDPELRRHVYEVVGTLGHLAEAALTDARAVRDTGRWVRALGDRMSAHAVPRGA